MYLIEPIRNGEWIYNQGLLMAIQSYARDHLFLDDDIVFPYMPKPSVQILSLIHISEPTRREWLSRMPSSA